MRNHAHTVTAVTVQMRTRPSMHTKAENHAGSSDFDTNIVCSEKNGTPDTPAGENVEEGPAQCESTDT